MRWLMTFTVLWCALSVAGVAQEKPTKGNVLSKKFSDDVEVEGVNLNKQGDKAVLTFEDQFWGISVVDGKTLWTKKIDDDYDQKWDLVRWVDDSIVTIPATKQLEWVNGNTGAVVGSVPFASDGLDDLVEVLSKDGITDRVGVRRFGSLLVVPFSDAYQVIDLYRRKLVYQSSEELADLRYHIWGSTLLIGGKMDSVAMFDMDAGTLLYKQTMDDLKFDAKLFQSLIRYKDLAVMIFEDDIVLVNVATGKHIATLQVVVQDLETYEPLILNGSLHLLLQGDEQLSLLSVATGKTLWKKGASEEGFGHIVHAWPFETSDVLVTTSNVDDEIYVRRINGADGKLKWSTRLVRCDEEFSPGHYNGSSMLAKALLGTSDFNSATSWFRNYDLDSLGRQTYYSQMGVDSIGPYTDEDMMSLQSVQCIHESAAGAGIARYVAMINGNLTIVTQGLVSKAWDGKISEEEADGEAIFNIDPSNGKINKVTPTAFTRHTEGTPSSNVYQLYAPKRNANGIAITGNQTMTFIRNSGEVDSMRFPVEEGRISRFNTGLDYTLVQYPDANDHDVIWRINFTPDGMKKQLVGYADEEKMICVFSDTVLANVSLRFEGDILYAYSPLSEIPKQWPKPLWSISRDALEDLGVGDFEATRTRNDVLGIHPHEDQVLVLGSDGIAFIEATTGCKKMLAWDGWKEKQYFRRSLRLFESVIGGFLFDLGPSAGVVKKNGACDVSMLAFKEDPADDLKIVFSELTSRIVIVNDSQNTIDIYQLNK